MNNAEINQKIKKHLDNALKLCREYDKERLITEWVDDIDFVEGYGYTEDLKAEVDYLEEQLDELSGGMGEFERPKIDYLDDQLKMEFLMKNFSKFSLSDLESIVD